MELSHLVSTLVRVTSVVSLLAFSQMRLVPAALSIGNHKYVKALAKVWRDIDHRLEVRSDQLLLIVLLLSSYEIC